jgi:hypothetical protein
MSARVLPPGAGGADVHTLVLCSLGAGSLPAGKAESQVEGNGWSRGWGV